MGKSYILLSRFLFPENLLLKILMQVKINFMSKSISRLQNRKTFFLIVLSRTMTLTKIRPETGFLAYCHNPRVIIKNQDICRLTKNLAYVL